MSLKIEKTGLFAIKEKTRARTVVVVPCLMCTRHVYTRTCDTRILARATAFAAAVVEIYLGGRREG